MTNARILHISLDHLTAELIAFPFVSRQSLETPFCELNLRMGGRTGPFWRRTEQYFVQRFPNLSLDELVTMRNAAWFGPGNRLQFNARTDPVIRLDELLRSFSREWLKQDGGVARPRLPQMHAVVEAPEPAARRAWRWMMFSMPSDLLLAGLAHNNSGPTRVAMTSPAVDALLRENGIAETHLHMGAAFDFSTAWAAVVNSVGREAAGSGQGMKHDEFKSPGADHDEGRELAHWLVRGCIVRYILGVFLRGSLPGASLKDFLEEFGIKDRWAVSDLQRGAIKNAIRDLQSGTLSVSNLRQASQRRASFAQLQSAYNALSKVSTFTPPKTLDDAQRLDPLREFFPVHGYEGPSIQLQFLWCGLQYISDYPDDTNFSHLFWQVERVRGQVYRHCVQRPLTPGLMNFIRFYDRKSPLLKLAENVEMESSATLGGVGHGLRSLEVRTSPKKDADGQLKQIEKLKVDADKLRNRNQPPKGRLGRLDGDGWANLEIGLVLHFLKFRGDDADVGLPRALEFGNHADPCDLSKSAAKDPNNGLRWRGYVRNNQRASSAIGTAIRKKPELLEFFRGLDVCRDEHGVPSWIVAPLFQKVRQRISDVAANYRLQTGIELPPLHTTAHVGEDFVHLATGLRYMDEALEHLQLTQGDRIGHGLALGIRPDIWASETTRMAMPLEDRWLDLIWERRLHVWPGAQFSNARRTFIEDEIVRLSKTIFRQPIDDVVAQHSWTVADALELELVSWLHDPKMLAAAGFPNGQFQTRAPQGLERQFERYLSEPAVYRRCRSAEWVCVKHDRDAVVELQRLVRKRYADLGITIEVNPISNLLVGNLTDLKSHPLWRLAPGLGNDDGATLRICVGSDDPFPFATNLPEEYQFLYDSLILAERSHAEACEWLRMIQRLGLESRFTVPVNT